jgi:flavin-dependent dehydrogenase
LTPEVVVVGAGPAGSIAALVLARAGVRVRILDRLTFPRPKLCGDTINPGTLGLLRRLGVSAEIERRGRPVEGMVVTGEDGVAVEGRYPRGLSGCAINRRELDAVLLRQAVAAGAVYEAGAPVRRAVLGGDGVQGVLVGHDGGGRAVHARVTIAADGRRSTLAFGLGLARHPARPRRWAIGGYFDDVAGMTSMGEMHIRDGRYIGVARTPEGAVNVCLVKPAATGELGDPRMTLWDEIRNDPVLGRRFGGARLVTDPTVLGPLAVDAATSADRLPPGLLLAGDAAGFVDPMTGDGLRFAVQGGELAAHAALRALARGWDGVHRQHDADRRRAFAGKWRFNRALRMLVGSASALRAAGTAARMAPSVVRVLIARAGDCDLA